CGPTGRSARPGARLPNIPGLRPRRPRRGTYRTRSLRCPSDRTAWDSPFDLVDRPAAPVGERGADLTVQAYEVGLVAGPRDVAVGADQHGGLWPGWRRHAYPFDPWGGNRQVGREDAGGGDAG